VGAGNFSWLNPSFTPILFCCFCCCCCCYRCIQKPTFIIKNRKKYEKDLSHFAIMILDRSIVQFSLARAGLRHVCILFGNREHTYVLVATEEGFLCLTSRIRRGPLNIPKNSIPASAISLIYIVLHHSVTFRFEIFFNLLPDFLFCCASAFRFFWLIYFPISRSAFLFRVIVGGFAYIHLFVVLVNVHYTQILKSEHSLFFLQKSININVGSFSRTVTKTRILSNIIWYSYSLNFVAQIAC
jgi:hypothetical protein